MLGTFRRDTAKVTIDCQTVCALQLSYTVVQVDGSSGFCYITLFVSNSYSLDFRRDMRKVIFNSLYVILRLFLVVCRFCFKFVFWLLFFFRKKMGFQENRHQLFKQFVSKSGPTKRRA